MTNTLAGRGGVRLRTTRPTILFIGIVIVLIATMIGGLMTMRQRRLDPSLPVVPQPELLLVVLA
jgi:hypothetical protein